MEKIKNPEYKDKLLSVSSTIMGIADWQLCLDPEKSWKDKVKYETLKEVIEYLEEKEDTVTTLDDVGELLKDIMSKTGKTNTAIAEELGMSRQSVHQYISRKPETMKVGKFLEIVNALGYDVLIARKPE